MTAKFISSVLKAASVAAVPLAMLAASVPANAQRPAQQVLAQIQRASAAVLGVDPYGSFGYGNSRAYQDGRYGNENYDNEQGRNENYKNGHHKNKNRNYKNGYYRHGRGNDGYNNERGDNNRGDNDRADNGRRDNGRYSNRYPSRGGVRYPSSPVIPGFPNVNVPRGRAGKTLPGTYQQPQQRNNNRHRAN